jgi:hypothetical protein
MDTIFRWLERHIWGKPCHDCQQRLAIDDTYYLQSTLGQYVPFCETCYDARTRPYSKAAQK